MNAADFHKYLANPELLSAETVPQLKELVGTNPTFQQAWMLLLKNLKMLGLAEFDEYLAKGAFYVTDRKRLYYFLLDHSARESRLAEREMEALSEEYSSIGGYQVEENQEHEVSLADLARSLRRKHPEAAPAEPQEADPEEAPDFVTETLAKIYTRQGMYKQAILAYEKLSLKYPEKNIYFAGQIEEVKKLMN